MDALLAEFAKHCAQADGSDLPKYRRLMNAIQNSMENGRLAPGDRLPTEQDFVRAVPYALGTVQRALNGLVTQGLLKRSRRSGTFVSDRIRPLDDTSQFDFKRTDGSPIGDVLSEITDISRTHDQGRRTAVLGDCPAGFVEIRRMDRIGSDFECYVEIHLRADRFSDLLTKDRQALSGQNIRTVLSAQYNLAVASLEVSSGAVKASSRPAQELGIAEGDAVHQVEIVGFDAGNTALYLQTTYAPAGDYLLTIRKDIN